MLHARYLDTDLYPVWEIHGVIQHDCALLDMAMEGHWNTLKRFLARERRMVHVKLSAAMKRKLEARSRKAGVPIDELARRWIEQAIERHVG